MASRNGKKTNGLRILWIPGRKRSHPKGRFDSTSKRIEHSPGHKKNEPWSLGGSKGQKDLLTSEGDGPDSPSISGLARISCAAGMPTIAATTNMPVLTENKFALLGKLNDNDQLPTPPKVGDNEITNNHVSASDLINNLVSNHNLKKIDEDVEDDLPSPPGCDEHNSSDAVSDYSPHKKHLSTNNKKSNSNNRPENDINSIESVSEYKLKYSDLDLPDSACNISQIINDKKKNKKKKKKNKNKNSSSTETFDEEDDKVVKCLYYTLMCCECTVS